MRNTVPTLLCDFYKISHREQYPEKTEKVYSTWTPRMSRIPGVDKVVAFGFQGFIKKYLLDMFQEHFFNKPKNQVVEEYARVLKYCLGVENPHTKHIEDLHDLGYLPLLIKALPEGTQVPIRIPMMTIENTDPRFFWLTNYIETLASCTLWAPSTSATISNRYRKMLDEYAIETVGNDDFVPFQGHDFSMRGMSSLESAMVSGAGHLLSFVGTDTIPAILYAEQYYNADIEKEMVGTSIPATEHSVQCAYENDDRYIERMITEVYPKGFVSIVSDGYDFWDVINNVVPILKKEILARDGKVVIRPDSGDPVKIVAGDPDAKTEHERMGAIECLWDTFGGTISDQGFKVLDPHIGLIYGDAITFDRCKQICEKLHAKGFASVNVVYGIGSYTYQYNTRDTFGFALKSTYCEIDGKGKKIFKDPKTDRGEKKSQKGRVLVFEEDGKLCMMDDLSAIEDRITSEENLLRPIFENGTLLVDESFYTIKDRLNGE